MTGRVLRRRRTLIALAGALLVAIALGSELLLPMVAAGRLRSHLGNRFDDVRSVEVSSAPALRLLWGDADEVSVALGDAQLKPGADSRPGDLTRARQVDLTADSVSTGRLTLDALALAKRGDRVRAEFTLVAGDGRLEPVAAQNGRLELRLRTPFGGAVPLTVTARDGQLRLRGRDGASVPLPGRAGAADQLWIERVTAAPGAAGPRVTLEARTIA